MNYNKIPGLYLKYFLWLTYVIKFFLIWFITGRWIFNYLSYVGDYFYTIYWLLLYSIFLIPFIDAPIIIVTSFIYQPTQTSRLKRLFFSILTGIAGSALIAVTTIIIAFFIVWLANTSHLPYTKSLWPS